MRDIHNAVDPDSVSAKIAFTGIADFQLPLRIGGYGFSVLPGQQQNAQTKVPDINQFKHHLLPVRRLLLPPLPAIVIQKLGTLDPDGAVPFVVLVCPVCVDFGIHAILQIQHGEQLLLHVLLHDDLAS